MNRYKYIFNGKWKILLKDEKLYDIVDTMFNVIIESYDSAVDVKHRLKKLNKNESICI